MRVKAAKALLVLYVFALVLSLVACNRSGSEYVGKWQSTKNKNDQLEIVRNGSNFQVTRIRMGKPSGATIPFVLKDGVLQSIGGFGTVTFTYVKNTDRLTTPAMFGANVEYERVK